jgi:hypothetical protein
LNLRLHSSRQSSQPRPKLRGPLLEALEFDLHAEAGEVGRVAVRCCYSSSLRHAAMVAPSISAVGCRLRFRRQLSARTGAVEGSCRFAYPSRHLERVSSGLDLAFTDNRVFSTALERLRLRNINAQFSNLVMAAPDINIADFDAVSRVLRASTRRATIYSSEHDFALQVSKARRGFAAELSWNRRSTAHTAYASIGRGVDAVDADWPPICKTQRSERGPVADSEHVRILLDDVEYERFQHSESGRLDAVGADLRTQNLSGRRLQDVDLTGADLRGTNFFMSRLSGVTFRDAKLDGALLSEADVFDCDLVSADLSNVSLTGTTILKGDASMARFQNASLAWAAFRGIKLEGANFTDAYAYRTVWAALDLQAVRGLDRMSHGGPSTVGLDTVQASAGRIPKSFLQGCGVPDKLIEYVQRLAHEVGSLRPYSCFISYSNRDLGFCQRLHTDLQASGVRCWFAPEDLKIGDKFRDQIDSAIRIHDKLLLVLSEQSVQSEWVASEVERAFEREQHHRDHLVLFPVRLDDAVMQTSQSWAAEIRRRRHIGDFSGWKDHDAYQKAFQRLLRDLRAAGAEE